MWSGCALWKFKWKFEWDEVKQLIFSSLFYNWVGWCNLDPRGTLTVSGKQNLLFSLGSVFLIKSSWNLDRVKRLLVHSKEDSKHQITSLTSVNPFASTLELFLVSLAVFFLPAVRYLSSFSAFASASKINKVWWGWSTAVRSISYNTIRTQYTYTRWRVTSC